MGERLSDRDLDTLLDLYEIPDDGHEYEGLALYAFQELKQRRAAEREAASGAEEAWRKFQSEQTKLYRVLEAMAGTEVRDRQFFNYGHAAGRAGAGLSLSVEEAELLTGIMDHLEKEARWTFGPPMPALRAKLRASIGGEAQP